MVPYIPLSMHIVASTFFQAVQAARDDCELLRTHKAILELSQFSIPETVIFGQMPVICGHQSWSLANA
jgi:hypothetical protein